MTPFDAGSHEREGKIADHPTVSAPEGDLLPLFAAQCSDYDTALRLFRVLFGTGSRRARDLAVARLCRLLKHQ